jgi:LysR family transcriptional regulator, benzoate and cis,cis-muconate-responsive activator of ben and cat genes
MAFKRGQLQYFVTVAEDGQMTRAARRLHIAQPALSQAISQLESELGLELLVRHPRGVTLTPAGEAFLPKARAVVASEQDAAQLAQSLARTAKGTLEVGFSGAPPLISAPDLFAAFAEAHPEAEVTFHDLPFPRGSTVSWLEDVDVAFCHRPAVETCVRMQPVRVEPRAVVVHDSHALAQRSELAVAAVLDETFVSYHPQVQPAWAGFHSLDDHRGGPPRQATVDHAAGAFQMLGIMTSLRAITALPLTDAKLAERILPDVVAIPLCDADPAVPSLVWRGDNHNPLVGALAALAQGFAAE